MLSGSLGSKLPAVVLLFLCSVAFAQCIAEDATGAVSNSSLRLEHADVPMYPQLARVAHIQGTVEVLVTVKDGEVVGSQPKSPSSGPIGVLTKATTDNVNSWRFYDLDSGTFVTKFVYVLDGNEHLDPLNPKVELQLPFLAKITAVPTVLDQK